MTQKMCIKSINTYPSTIKFVSECFECVIMQLIDVFVTDSIPDRGDKVASEDPFLIVY